MGHKKYTLIFLSLIFISCYDKNLWAVLISTSSTFENYRHSSNNLKIYQVLKRNNFPDEKIIVMNSEDFACNPRNTYPGYAYFSEKIGKEKVCCVNEFNVDYKSTELTNFSILNLLKGRSDNILSNIRKLNTNSESRILIYVTSHGGLNFIRVRTKMVILNEEFKRALLEMKLKNRFKEIVFILDTCEAFTFFEDNDIPNVYFVGSSLKDQKAYSLDYENFLITPLSDRFTYRLSQIATNMIDRKSYTTSIDKIFEEILYDKEFIRSDVGIIKNMDRDVKFGGIFGDGNMKIFTEKQEFNVPSNDESFSKFINHYFNEINLSILKITSKINILFEEKIHIYENLKSDTTMKAPFVIIFSVILLFFTYNIFS